MIYVPEKDSYQCYVVQSEGVIRAYETVPTNNSNILYRDYYISSNYIYKDGFQSFGNYATLPVCLDMNEITSDFYYRNDFDSILIIFTIMSMFCILLPLKIFFRLFKRGRF